MKAQESQLIAGGDHDFTALESYSYVQRLQVAIVQHLQNVPEFQRLQALRKEGWEKSTGDHHFAKQRQAADNGDAKTAVYFYNMMQKIAREMNQDCSALKLKSFSPHQLSILDMCMAPGGYLTTALRLNPQAKALAFTLPPADGGHDVLLPESSRVTTRFLDVTMLAADAGISSNEIPPDHPYADKFLSSQISEDQRFDLTFCDGQVRRTHPRPEHRKRREATRLILTQLIISLTHLKPGGTMVVLLHKLEAPDVVLLLHAFDKFATVRLFKPIKSHATRSSFYMIATDVMSHSGEAKAAIERWRNTWKIATFEFGIERSVYTALVHKDSPEVERVVEEFGARLIELGRKIWDIQANALEKASWMREGEIG
ncbi:hypothetical protein BDV06DRAFT_158423 [Aspergillus oleicola]